MKKILCYGIGVIVLLFYVPAHTMEYQCHVITDTGTYAIYKDTWENIQKYMVRKGKSPYVVWLSYSEPGRIVYSEDFFDRVIAKVFPSTHPLNKELKNVGSWENLKKAAKGDDEAKEQVQTNLWTEKIQRWFRGDMPTLRGY